MTDRWEDVPERKWEDVESPKWEDVEAPSSAILDSKTSNDIGEDFARRGKAALGGEEIAIDMVAGLPHMAVSGLGKLLDPTYNIGNASGGLTDWDKVVPHHEFQTPEAREARETLEGARDWVGHLGAPLGAGLQSADEFAFDMITGMVPFGPHGARGRVSPREKAWLNAKKSVEDFEAKQNAPKGPPLDAPKGPPLEGQGELPLEGGGKGPGVPPNLSDMMERAQERMGEATDQQLMRSLDQGQPDLFGPTQPKESFPGLSRSEELRRQQEALPYDQNHLLEAPELLGDTRLNPFRPEDMDFPLRQEAWDADPYVQTLKAEYDKWVKQYRVYDRRAKTTGYPGDRVRSDKGLANANEVARIVREYAERDYNISKPDHYSGTLWGDSPTALRVEKTERPRLGTKGPAPTTPTRGLVKSSNPLENPILKSPIRRKQAGTIDFFSPKGEKDRRMAQISEELKKLDKSIATLEKLRDAGKDLHAGDHDKRLEKLYYAQMRLHNEVLHITDPDHPLNQLKSRKALNTGKIGRQKGAIDFPGFMRETLDRTKVDVTEAEKESYRATGRLGDMEGVVSKLRDDVIKAEATGSPTVTVEAEGLGPLPISVERAKQLLLDGGDIVSHLRDALARQLRIERQAQKDETVSNVFGKRDLPGWAKKQYGHIDLTKDPEFRKFKDELPENMKSNAKALYKEWKKMQGPREPEVLQNEPATEMMDKIPGLKTWRDEIAPIVKSPQEVLKDVLNEPDTPRDTIKRQLISGGKLYGFARQNTLIRYTVQTIDRAIREAHRNINDLILDSKTGFKPVWEKLSDKEMGEVWSQMVVREGKEDLTREAMYELGWNDKQIEAAEGLRKSLDKVYDILNDARAARGKKPFEKRLGYIPSRFRGDFVVDVRDADGNLVHRIGAATQMGAESIKKYLQQTHPEFTYGETKHEPMHRFKDASDANAGYQALLEVLDDEDPRVSALESAYQDFLAKRAYDVLSVKKHFWDKKGVGGAEGFKEWKDAVDNAHEGLRSVMNYMDHAMKWAELQKTYNDLGVLLKDKQVEAKQPNALKYSQDYIDQALGRSSRVARAFDTLVDVVADTTGIGESLQLKGIREVKKWMTAKFLGFYNLGFSLSQFMQVLQTVPSWMIMLQNKGAKASAIGAYMNGVIDASKGYFLGRERMTALSQEAWEYAKDYGIVDPQIIDHIKGYDNWGGKITDIVKDIAFSSIQYPEKMARTQAYLAWVHFLHETGEFKMGRELYETAANMTDMTMVDYRQHERPNFYKQLGVMGEMANALTTYKHNYYTQLWALSQHRKGVGGGPKGGNAPLYGFLASQALLAGAIGLPGREDLDSLIKFMNMASPFRIPTTREMIMKAPDMLSFGAASTLSGFDLSSKFSAANLFPDNMLSGLFPFAEDMGKMGKAAAGALFDPSTTSAMKMALAFSPNSTQGLAEKYFERDGVQLDPNTLEGKVRRNGRDKVARYLGLRGLNESKQSHDYRTEKEQDSFYKDKREGLLQSAKDAMYDGDMEKVQRLARKYTNEYEGTIDSYIDALIGNKEAQKMTAMERRVYNALQGDPRKVQRYKELQR